MEAFEGADEAKLTPRTVRRAGRKPVVEHESSGVRDDESACNLITVNSEIEDLLSSEKSASVLRKRETQTPPKREAQREKKRVDELISSGEEENVVIRCDEKAVQLFQF